MFYNHYDIHTHTYIQALKGLATVRWDNTAILDSCQMRHLKFPSCDIINTKFCRRAVSTCTSHDFNETFGRIQKVAQLLGGFVDIDEGSEVLVLCRHTRWTCVRIANTSGNTSNGLHGAVGDGDAISTKTQCLHEISRSSKTTRRDQCHMLCTNLVQISTSSG